MSWQKEYIKKSFQGFFINTDQINWKFKLVIPLKHIILSEPCIADGKCLCALWADKSRDDFIQNTGLMPVIEP